MEIAFVCTKGEKSGESRKMGENVAELETDRFQRFWEVFTNDVMRSGW
jgi:hypothetical protein